MTAPNINRNRGRSLRNRPTPEFGRCSCGGIVVFRGLGKPPTMCDACRNKRKLDRARMYTTQRAARLASAPEQCQTKTAEPDEGSAE